MDNSQIADRPDGFASMRARRSRAGTQIVCSADARSTRGLDDMSFSVSTARRGWATPAHVLNTRPLAAIREGRLAAG